MGNEKTESNADALAYGAASGLILAATGLPVPPTVLKNATTAVGSLVKGALKIPSALIDAKVKPIEDGTSARAAVSQAETRAKVQAIEDDAKARSLVSEAAARAVAERFAKDEALVGRAVDYHTARLLGEQENREAVAEVAVAELNAKPTNEDAQAEIEQDWLNMFARHAETKSSDQMRGFFGRILAGEIRKPGSFSPATVEVLARLTHDTASLFQRFCSISCELGPEPCVIAAPYGAPGNNALSPLGFNYSTLCRLADAGLIRPNFDSHHTLAPIMFTTEPLQIGSLILRLTTNMSAEEVRARLKARERVSSLLFTTAGQELRRIVNMTVPDPHYVATFLLWAAKHDMQPAGPVGVASP